MKGNKQTRETGKIPGWVSTWRSIGVPPGSPATSSREPTCLDALRLLATSLLYHPAVENPQLVDVETFANTDHQLTKCVETVGKIVKALVLNEKYSQTVQECQARNMEVIGMSDTQLSFS